ncbi:hypothetical protein ABBQ38_007841 [Trebouxia sp. C0009 RCD-2024]
MPGPLKMVALDPRLLPEGLSFLLGLHRFPQAIQECKALREQAEAVMLSVPPS